MSRDRENQDRLAKRLSDIVGEREPTSGFPRPTLLPLPEGCAVINGVEVTIDVTVPPEVAAAMLLALAGSRRDGKPDAEADAR